MSTIAVKTGNGSSINIDYEFGATLSDAVKMFGEAVVLDKFRQKAVSEVRGIAQVAIAAGKNPDQVRKQVATWKPHVGRQKLTAAEKYERLFGKLDAKEQAEVLGRITS